MYAISNVLRSWTHVSLLAFLFSIYVVPLLGKPEISGPSDINAPTGENVTLECMGDKFVMWFKLVRKSGDTSVVDEEPHTSHFHLEPPEYVEWPDAPEDEEEKYLAVLHIEDLSEDDAGTYICTYEEGDIKQILKRIKRNKEQYFSKINLTVTVMSPKIDVGRSLVISPGDNVNLTCSGEKPVTWILMNNHTWGIQHTENRTSDKTEYLSILQIVNANYTDVGYFICKFTDGADRLYEDFDHLSDVNSASTYLFVKDLNHLLVKSDHDVREISAELGSKVIVPCKPTFPDVNVTLSSLYGRKISYDSFDPKNGFTLNKSSQKDHQGLWNCYGKTAEHGPDAYMISIRFYDPVLLGVNLTVDGSWQVNSLKRDENTYAHIYDIIEGDVLLVNCSSHYKKSSVNIMWKTPQNRDKNKTYQVRLYEHESNLVEELIFPDVSKEKDSGVYACYVTNGHVNSSAYSFALNVFPFNSAHLELRAQNENVLLPKSSKYPEPLKWIIFFRAYPALYLNWTINNKTKIDFTIENDKIDHGRTMVKRKEQFEIKVNWAEGEITLKIHSPSIRDTGTYVLYAEVPGKHEKKNVTLKFFKEGEPEDVNTIIGPGDLSKKVGARISVECSAYGYPFPNLKVLFKPCSSRRKCDTETFIEIKSFKPNNEVLSESTSDSQITGMSTIMWTGEAKIQGFYFCMAENIYGTQNSSKKPLIISDSDFESSDLLQIEVTKNKKTFVALEELNFVEGDKVKAICRGNTLETSPPLVWTFRKGSNNSKLLLNSKSAFGSYGNITVNEWQTDYSYISEIETKLTNEMNGLSLSCFETSDNPLEHTVNISVIGARSPVWSSKPLSQKHVVKNENEKLSLECAGDGIPEPTATWFKDDKKIKLNDNDRRISIYEGILNVEFLFPEDSGKYSCMIANREGILEDFVTLEVNDKDAAPNIALIATIGVISALLVIFIIIFLVKCYKDRRDDRVFRLEEQRKFNEGNPESLNPDLDLGEQADLLPYDQKFEFPSKRVTVECLLGSGAFGNVFRATAIDLISGESKTTVAVKMMKPNAHRDEIKTLVSELKIMIHIGRHINIVNLLGACSINMASKGELWLIVEYCRHGNILEYMRRHKSEFVNQINEYDKIDPNMKSFRRRTFSNSSRYSQRTTYAQLDLHRNSVYDSSNLPNGSPYNRASLIENSIVDPTGRKRIQSDSSANDVLGSEDMKTVETSPDNYITENTLEQRGPLCSRDMLHWAYQIANGMFYLSEKKVIHGDLAARNILLTDKNVVKISDFGLSKNICKQEHYKKKSKCPMPVKWLALEALRDSIFSTHSDVWSYGIVLWEIFSLGSNPYAGIEPDAQFIARLAEGLRLRKPSYATTVLFNIMLQCWQENPNDRPSFRELEKALGDMLGETEKQMYMTLNADYEENNYESEHLKFINTPTYEARTRAFFSEKDEFGYERAMDSPFPGVFMEEGRFFPRTSPSRFQLQQVPKKKTYSVNIQNNPGEMESLLKENPGSDYLVMKSPSGLEKSSPEVIPMQSVGKDGVTYANISHINTNAEQNNSHVITIESPVIRTSPNDPAFGFAETDLGDNDSVFFEECKNTHMSTFKPQTSVRYTVNRYPDNNRYHSNRDKHDSGFYSPNGLQNNPIYVQTSNVCSETPNELLSDKDQFGIKLKSSNEKKPRTHSETSSGIGSLTDEQSNSLEKNHNLEIVQESSVT